MAFIKSLSGQVTRDELSAQVTRDALAKAETNVYFLNNCDCDLSLGGVFAEMPCDGVLLLQKMTTLSATRWGEF